MRIIKIILLTIVAIIGLYLVAALFTPKQYTASATITINKPASVVYDYMKILKNQEQYSEWVKADPNLKPEITGTDGTVGAEQKWNSPDDNVGEGIQKITQLTSDRIDVDLTFIRPFESKAKAATIFKSISENETQVTSEFYAEEAYPMNLLSYVMGKKMIEKTELKNLQNVKEILEKQ